MVPRYQREGGSSGSGYSCDGLGRRRDQGPEGAVVQLVVQGRAIL